MTHCKPGIRISLLLTGNEIMAGDIIDSNSAFIAQQLLTLGLKINKKVTIGDEMASIIDTINLLSKESDIVIMNGGLGATVDDLTAEAVAYVIGAELKEHPLAIENITKRYGADFIGQNPDYLNHLRKQAILPEGVDVIPNPVGLAVGFKVNHNNAVFYFTPGVPKEMKAMIMDSILPDIQKKFDLKPTSKISKFQVIGLGESKMQQKITQTFPTKIWDVVDLGFRASTGVVEVKFSVTDEDSLPALIEAEDLFRTIAPAETIAKGKSIQQYIIEILRDKSKNIIILDDCTGGRLFQSMDSVPESQAVLKFGLQANSEEILDAFLNLFKNEYHTNPSELKGIFHSAIEDLSNTCFLAVSSCSDSKDLSKTVTIHWGEKGCLESRNIVIKRDRDTMQQCVSVVALDMLRRYLQDLPKDNPYYFDELTRKELR
ncbi:CinA family protein [bacterium]|nr:CinA family protein [bacterium]